MAVIFSHSSALAILRSAPPQSRMLRQVTEPLPLAAISTRAADLSAFDTTRFGITGPRHVLVAHSASKVVAKGVVSHRSSLQEIPAGLLYELQPSVYVCGPELVFAQMTSELTSIGLTVLGYELCGRYSQFARMVSGFYDRRPLTSTERIVEALGQLPHMAGTRKARTALGYVRNNSRSPMESVVSAMLYLPADVGGYGLVPPVLNKRVTLDDAAASRLGKRRCYIDTCWPEPKIGLEYDSAAFHTDAEGDRLRREALAHMGWTIYTLAPDDVSDVRTLGRMVDLFVDRVPQVKPGVVASEAQHAELLRRLFVLTRRGLGMNELLFADAAKTRSVKVHL